MGSDPELTQAGGCLDSSPEFFDEDPNQRLLEAFAAMNPEAFFVQIGSNDGGTA